MKFPDFSLQNYVLGDPNVPACAMGCVHGSINEILSKWDPGPTYIVQRLWDPGGPSYTSRSSFTINLEKICKPTSYLDYIPPTTTTIPSIPSHPNVDSTSQTPPREARPYGELQVHT